MKKIMEKIGFVALCIVLFFASAGIAFNIRMNVRGTAPYRTVRVKTDPDLWTVTHDLDSDGNADTKYDLYLPANPDPDREYSLIFHIHGGGFTAGDKEDGARILPYYASRGMIGVSANYSLASDEHPADLNKMFAQLRNTVSVVKEHCAELGYHITEMATTGESAGGCLALLLAYREPEASAIPVKFTFVQSAPANFDPTIWGFTEQADLAKFVTNMSGKPFTVEDIGSADYQAAIDGISPSAYVSAQTVPTILAYGPRDVIVPPSVKDPLLENLEQSGATYQYLEFSNSGHGLLHNLDMSDEYFRLADQYIDTYFTNGR